MQHYQLPEHVHACATSDDVVLLDLRRDKYLAIPNAQNSPLEEFVDGWPKPATVRHLPPGNRDPKELLETLISMDLITANKARPIRPPIESIPRPNTPILHTVLLHTLLPNSPPPPHVRPMDVINFTRAYMRARVRLRCNTLETVISHIKSRKQRHKTPKEDLEVMRTLVAKARLIRPFVYQPANQCLLDSYVLIEYLAIYKLFPIWVFGVQTRPFLAHCWVQSGLITLNENPGTAARFTPIMAV